MTMFSHAASNLLVSLPKQPTSVIVSMSFFSKDDLRRKIFNETRNTATIESPCVLVRC